SFFISGVTFWPNWRRWFLVDLYEQCSDHMTEYMANSAAVGRRPRILTISANSLSFRPSSAHGSSTSGVPAALSTVSILNSLVASWLTFCLQQGGSERW